jgi:hypothetical protein
MTTPIERRLAKLEEALQPQPVRSFCLLAEPLTDATPETWEEHWKQIEEAKASGDFVAVVSSVRPGGKPHAEKGVTYYPNDFEAQLVEASMLPSKRGNKSLLDDIFKTLGGKVWEPSATPIDIPEDDEMSSYMAM